MPGRMWQRDREGRIIRSPALPPTAPGDGGAAATGGKTARPRVNLVLALRLGLRDTYDYLGAVLLLSGVWSVAAGVAALGGFAAAEALFSRLPGPLYLLLAVLVILGALALAGGPLLAGVFRFARNAAARREPEVFDLAWGFRSAFGRSVSLAALQLFGGFLLAANGYFYLFISRGQPLLLVL